jgi:hypothetical protein
MSVWDMMEQPLFAAIVSFLIGFGIAAMFRPVCRDGECIVINGPPVKEVINKVYQMGEKCVEFSTEITDCPKDSKEVVKTVEFVGSS